MDKKKKNEDNWNKKKMANLLFILEGEWIWRIEREKDMKCISEDRNASTEYMDRIID